MLSPLTRILIKIFVIGFYQVHSGMLTFFFVTIFLYCIFINVLNRTHLSHEQIVLHNLKVVLAFISSPIIALLVCIMLLAYTIKSWKYVLGQILLPNNLFLFYSGTSIHKVDQFKSWFLVQVMISLPIMGYVLFSLVIGFFLATMPSHSLCCGPYCWWSPLVPGFTLNIATGLLRLPLIPYC